MGPFGRHDHAFARPQRVNASVHREAAPPAENQRQRVAAGIVGADLLALVKGEQGDAYMRILAGRWRRRTRSSAFG